MNVDKEASPCVHFHGKKAAEEIYLVSMGFTMLKAERNWRFYPHMSQYPKEHSSLVIYLYGYLFIAEVKKLVPGCFPSSFVVICPELCLIVLHTIHLIV